MSGGGNQTVIEALAACERFLREIAASDARADAVAAIARRALSSAKPPVAVLVPDPNNPGWCIGCNPDNCEGCGNGLPAQSKRTAGGTAAAVAWEVKQGTRTFLVPAAEFVGKSYDAAAFRPLVYEDAQAPAPVAGVLEAFDAAIAAELPRVSHVEYDSREICAHFAGEVRKLIATAAGQAIRRPSGLPERGGIAPPVGGWEAHTLYLVTVAFKSNNFLHHAYLNVGFLDNNGAPGSYSELFCTGYDRVIQFREAYFLEVVKKLHTEVRP